MVGAVAAVDVADPPPDAAELVRGAHLQSANKQSVAATA
jgi:hypothetical protein